MKPISRIITTAFIFFLMLAMAQGQREYRKAYIVIGIPAIVENVKKTLRFENGKVIENREEKKSSVGLNVSLDDMQLDGNNFSGIKVTTYPVSEEIISFTGVLSDDHSMIKTITIDQQYIKYNLADRSKAHVEEKISASYTFENIPKQLRGYVYDMEKTEITKARWLKYRYLKYRAISETTISKLISVDKESINKWTQCVLVQIKPTNYTAEAPERNKVAVVTAGCDKKMKGNERYEQCGPIAAIYAVLVYRFSKAPGMVVLQRENMEPLLLEQKLSESGLVEEASMVESGKIIDEDILVIIQLQEPAPDDPPETYHYKLLVENKQTGEIDDTGISARIDKGNPFFNQFVMSAYAYVMKNYFM